MWIEPIYLYVILYYLIVCVFAFVERSCAVSGVSYSSGSGCSRIVREVIIAGKSGKLHSQIVREFDCSRIVCEVVIAG